MMSIKAAFLLSLLVTAGFETVHTRRLNREKFNQVKKGLGIDKVQTNTMKETIEAAETSEPQRPPPIVLPEPDAKSEATEIFELNEVQTNTMKETIEAAETSEPDVDSGPDPDATSEATETSELKEGLSPEAKAPAPTSPVYRYQRQPFAEGPLELFVQRAQQAHKFLSGEAAKQEAAEKAAEAEQKAAEKAAEAEQKAAEEEAFWETKRRLFAEEAAEKAEAERKVVAEKAAEAEQKAAEEVALATAAREKAAAEAALRLQRLKAALQVEEASLKEAEAALQAHRPSKKAEAALQAEEERPAGEAESKAAQNAAALTAKQVVEEQETATKAAEEEYEENMKALRAEYEENMKAVEALQVEQQRLAAEREAAENEEAEPEKVAPVSPSRTARASPLLRNAAFTSPGQALPKTKKTYLLPTLDRNGHARLGHLLSSFVSEPVSKAKAAASDMKEEASLDHTWSLPAAEMRRIAGVKPQSGAARLVQKSGDQAAAQPQAVSAN